MAKIYKPNKDPKKHIVKKMQETEGLNKDFGKFDEDTGGGHPFEKGNSNTRTTKENGELRKEENPDTMQPRKADGTFTYKSVNGESLKSGPSRGKTVPPTLTGGVDGETIYIEDLEKGFSNKSGAYWDKYKGKFYTAGAKVVTVGLSTKISLNNVWDMAKEYNKNLGEFKGESENWQTKSGKKSKEEKAAQDLAKKTKEQQFVKNVEDDSIQTVGKKSGIAKKFAEKFIEPKAEEKAPVVEEKVEEKVEEIKEQPKDEPWGKTGKFFKKHSDNLRAKLKEELGSEYDDELYDDDTIEDFLNDLSEEELKQIYDYKK